MSELDVMRQLDVDRAQGFAFGQPQTAHQIAGLLGRVHEKRGAQRVPVLISAERALVVPAGRGEPRIVEAVLLDVGERGVQLRLGDVAAVGDELVVSLGASSPEADFRASVVDVKQMGSSYRVNAQVSQGASSLHPSLHQPVTSTGTEQAA